MMDLSNADDIEYNKLREDGLKRNPYKNIDEFQVKIGARKVEDIITTATEYPLMLTDIEYTTQREGRFIGFSLVYDD